MYTDENMQTFIFPPGFGFPQNFLSSYLWNCDVWACEHTNISLAEEIC